MLRPGHPEQPPGEVGWPRISSEVYLWGTVVEHSHGWRAQFAYPKTLVVASPPGDRLLDGGSLSVEEVEFRLEDLTKYRAEILSVTGFPVWTARSGYNPAGIESLHEVLARMREILVRIKSLHEILAGNDSLRRILTQRELELLPFLCQGLTDHQIGCRMGLATHCIREYMFHIFDKLGVSSRIELVQLLMSPQLRPKSLRPGILRRIALT